MQTEEAINNVSSNNNHHDNNTNNYIIDEEGKIVDLSFLDRPLMSRAVNTFSYYKSVEQCSRDGIKVLMDDKIGNLLKVLTQPNSRARLKNGLDFKMCSLDRYYPQEFRSFPIGGYYSPTSEHIVICCDRMANQHALKETIAHEMVHVYDLARFGDLEDCNIRACTEIRAYNMTGTCDDAKKQSKYQYSREECAKFHALLSTVPMCGSIQGKASLEEVFHSCFNDLTPFDMKSTAANPVRLSGSRRRSPDLRF